MAMFALAMLLLIDKLNGGVRQSWYADDASAGGELNGLMEQNHTAGPRVRLLAKPC